MASITAGLASSISAKARKLADPTARIYRPRVRCILTVPFVGKDKKDQEDTQETIELPVRVRKLSIDFNGINHADEARVSCEYKDVGLDPRVLTNATAAIYIGEDPFSGLAEFQEDKDTLRFVGIVQRCNRKGAEDGYTLDIDFQDYTALFLANKYYPRKTGQIPYDIKVSDAWKIICDNTGPVVDGEVKSTVKALREKIRFLGGAQDSVIGQAVVPRFQKFGAVQLAPNMDSWAVWQQVVGNLGYVSYILLDEVIVTTTRDFDTQEDPPVFLWGNNIESINEERKANWVRKGIRVISYDPLTNSTLESLYPAPGSPEIVKKEVSAKTRKGHTPGPVTKAEQDRELIVYPAVTDQKRLDAIAQRIFDERNRQECSGTITTVEMRASRLKSLGDIDLLNLTPGQTIIVGFDPESKTALRNIGDRRTQINYLLERGYSEEAAGFMVDNLEGLDNLSNLMHVHTSRVEMDADENDVSFKISVNYINKIKIDGSTETTK